MSGAIQLSDVFSALPVKLRAELLNAFSEITRNFQERRWEPAELNGGKLSEVVYSILKGLADGKFPDRAKKPRNMLHACRNLEDEAPNHPRSVRIQIPRMLVALYEIRNNRNVGHIGGDVDPNHMDAVCVLQLSKWIVAELIRLLHEVSTDEATSLVDALADRETPLIWRVGDKKRVLHPGMSMKDKTLLLLHGENREVSERDLVCWVEHSNPSVYGRDVLRPAHRAKLLEYDPREGTVVISPLGIDYVETSCLRAA